MQDDLSPLIDGKVLRLHFACHAELPVGSTLRVTSSESWAGTHLSSMAATAPNGTSNSTNTNSFQPISNSNINQINDDDLDDTSNHSIYSSSVEMVTTPETYPIWRTRTPVIRVVNHTTMTNNCQNNSTRTDDRIFCHRYRYLVITPGKEIDDGNDMPLQSKQVMITSDGLGGVVEVDEWEDPFDEQSNYEQQQQLLTSPVSLAPFKKRNDELPYRTISIDVSSSDLNTFGNVLHPSSQCDFTSDSVKIDRFNDAADGTFLHYKKSSSDKTGNTTPVWNCSESDSDALLTSSDRKDLDTPMKNVHVESNMEPNTKRIFLVCYHLPIILHRDEATGILTAKWSESLLAKTEQSGVSKKYAAYWIGTVSSTFKTDAEKNAVVEVLKPMNCIPIFLDEGLRDSFYLGMCKQVLWPAFHNIDLLDISKSGWGNSGIADGPNASNWDQSRLDVWWNAYRQVNQIFSDTLMQFVKSHDKVWVHDYHLSLMPKMVHEAEITASSDRTIQMVYFLHIPFPTSQVFREIEHGGEILEGILYADVVGFHAFDHARHFLTASKRILGLPHESLPGGLIGVRFRKTKVLVTISNVSIETDVVDAALNLPSVIEGAKLLKQQWKGRQIVSGVDIAQGLSGISLKLLAYERMLSDYPNLVGNVILVQRNLIPSVRKSDEVDTLNHVRFLVRRIKKKFGSEVIDYDEIKGSIFPIEQRLVLWLCSDVFMSTPIREGLNVLPLEYVYVNKNNESPGVTIISEFSAMSSILNGAIRVNPFDVKLASGKLEQALATTTEMKVSRRDRDIHFISTSPSGQWTKNVLRDLKDVKLATAGDDESNKTLSRTSTNLNTTTSDFVLSALLDPVSVVSAYLCSEKRVIFVDFNGTIVMKEPAGKYLKREMLGISGNKPPEETIKALTKLCADKRNIVYVVSGDTEKNLENAIGDIPGLGLASGNGGSIAKPVGPGQTQRKWEDIDLGVDWGAVTNITLPILSKYTARANGSYVKQTSSSFGWSYYGCDPEWGEWLAAYLVVELEAALDAFDIRIVKLKGVVEVVPRKLNKGRIVKRVLRDNGADFVLCMGDDVSDEKMFTSVLSVLAESAVQQEMNIDNDTSHAFTVTVGMKASNASYFVENSTDVAELLIGMAGLHERRTKSWDGNDGMLSNIFA